MKETRKKQAKKQAKSAVPEMKETTTEKHRRKKQAKSAVPEMKETTTEKHRRLKKQARSVGSPKVGAEYTIQDVALTYIPERLSTDLSQEQVAAGEWKSFSHADSTEQVAAARTRQVQQQFERARLHYIQEEINRVASNDLTKKLDGKAASKRPDLKAMSAMMRAGGCINTVKRPGVIPGLAVGQHFFSRAEMCALGIHHHWLQGIDFAPQTKTSVAFATSICMSGGYEDDVDSGKEITYTGEGGNDFLGAITCWVGVPSLLLTEPEQRSKKQYEDQKLTRGNLALQGNMKLNIPVRVIRKCPDRSSWTKNVFIFDGRYNVTDCWPDRGESGYTIWRFKLRRHPDEPSLGCNSDQRAVTFKKGLVSVGGSLPASMRVTDRAHVVHQDIAAGAEKWQIPCVNQIDDSTLDLQNTIPSESNLAASCFKYITQRVSDAPGVPNPAAVVSLSEQRMRELNSPWLHGRSPFVPTKSKGLMVLAAFPLPVVYEQPNNGPDSTQHTCQNGIQFRLEVFRTANKGWGVRSWDSIPQGAFVCEFVGEVLAQAQAENRARRIQNGDEYMFDLDCIQQMKQGGGRELCGTAPVVDCESDEEEAAFTVDARLAGNVSRFVNHDKRPNMFMQSVLNDHHDLRLPRLCLFSAQNIPAMTELTYDYGDDYIERRLPGQEASHSPVKETKRAAAASLNTGSCASAATKAATRVSAMRKDTMQSAPVGVQRDAENTACCKPKAKDSATSKKSHKRRRSSEGTPQPPSKKAVCSPTRFQPDEIGVGCKCWGKLIGFDWWPAKVVALGIIPDGTKVCKDFDGEMFSGRVASYDKEAKWYRVTYEDGDEEEFTGKQLWPHLTQLAQETHELGPPPTSDHVALSFYGDQSWDWVAPSKVMPFAEGLSKFENTQNESIKCAIKASMQDTS